MCVGLAFSKVNFFSDSPQRILSPVEFPSPQDIMYNTELLMTSGSDISPSKLMGSLPEQDWLNLLPFGNRKENDQNKFEQ